MACLCILLALQLLVVVSYLYMLLSCWKARMLYHTLTKPLDLNTLYWDHGSVAYLRRHQNNIVLY